jgi:hypothetical protein
VKEMKALFLILLLNKETFYLENIPELQSYYVSVE